MNNFTKIFDNVDVDPMLIELNENYDLFNAMPSFLKPGNPGYEHREMHSLTLRMTPFTDDIFISRESAEKASDELFAYDLDVFNLFPQCRAFVYTLMLRIHASHIGRVCIARLDPGKRIYGHYDQGESAKFYRRYHLMLNGEKGNWIACGEGADEERLEMLTGECWSFNHELWHSFVNHSESPRVYLNMDLA